MSVGGHLGVMWGHLGVTWGSLGVTWGHLGVPFDVENDVDVHKWWFGGAEN